MDSPIAKGLLIFGAIALASAALWFGRELFTQQVEQANNNETFYQQMGSIAACEAIGGEPHGVRSARAAPSGANTFGRAPTAAEIDAHIELVTGDTDMWCDAP